MKSGNSTAADEKEAVLGALTELYAAFGRRDPAGWEAVCTPDYVFLGTTEGEEAIGHGPAIGDMFAAIAGRSVGAKFKTEWDSLDVEVTGDVALLTGLGTATYETPFRMSRTRYRLTGVLERRNGKWLWRLHHGSEPAPW